MWKHDLLASVVTAPLNAPTLERPCLLHNHYTNSLHYSSVSLLELQYMAVGTRFHAGYFQKLT